MRTLSWSITLFIVAVLLIALGAGVIACAEVSHIHMAALIDFDVLLGVPSLSLIINISGIVLGLKELGAQSHKKAQEVVGILANSALATVIAYLLFFKTDLSGLGQL